MNPNRYVLPLILLAVISGAGPGAADPSSATLVPFTARWPEPDQTAKPWTRWWWPGNALTPEDTRKDLDTMADAGLGGVEITPIYGSRDGRRTSRPFLSPAYLDILNAATQAAAARGLGVDMCTGTGGPFGGPNVTIENAAQKAAWSGGNLRAQPTKQQVKRAAPGGTWFFFPRRWDNCRGTGFGARPMTRLNTTTRPGPRTCRTDSWNGSVTLWRRRRPPSSASRQTIPKNSKEPDTIIACCWQNSIWNISGRGGPGARGWDTLPGNRPMVRRPICWICMVWPISLKWKPSAHGTTRSPDTRNVRPIQTAVKILLNH